MKSVRSLTPYDIITRSMNSDLWIGSKLKPEIHKVLLKETRKLTSKLKGSVVLDIVLTGSQTSPDMYTNLSDIDIHLIMRNSEKYINQIREYNNSNDISVSGIRVEFYPEEKGVSVPVCQGRYSLKTGRWIQKPCYNKVPVDSSLEYQIKLRHFIDKIINTPDNPRMKLRLKKQLKVMRSEGLKSDRGVYSTGNAVYKTLRNLGYLSSL